MNVDLKKGRFILKIFLFKHVGCAELRSVSPRRQTRYSNRQHFWKPYFSRTFPALDLLTISVFETILVQQVN